MNKYEWDDPPPPGTELDSDSSRDKTLHKREHRRSRNRNERSRSPDHRRRRRSRSRRRSHSRRRKRYSRSRSSSSSSHRRRHRRHRRSRSKSRRRRYRTRSRSRSRKSADLGKDIIQEEDMKIEDPESGQEDVEEEEEPAVPFKNDGSFLEMFKKMQEEKEKEQAEKEAEKKPVLPAFGKRRGGKVLKTGMVAKVRNVEEDPNNPTDAWTIYMKEVRKYKEAHCDDDSKTRPLVK